MDNESFICERCGERNSTDNQYGGNDYYLVENHWQELLKFSRRTPGQLEK